MRTALKWSAIASVLVVACSDPNDVASGSTAGQRLMAELNGGVYLLQSAVGYSPVEGTTIRVHFNDGEFGFSAGCNGHGGRFSVDDGRTLTITELGSTAMGCDEARHGQDAWLADFFTTRPTLALDGAELTVSGDEATLVFLDREVADPDRPLVGTLWTIDTTLDAAGAASSGGWAVDSLTLMFADDGSLTSQTPCGALTGAYAIAGDAVTLADMVYVPRAGGCSPWEDVDASIRDVLADGLLTYAIEAARLTLERGSIGLMAGAK